MDEADQALDEVTAEPAASLPSWRARKYAIDDEDVSENEGFGVASER